MYAERDNTERERDDLPQVDAAPVARTKFKSRGCQTKNDKTRFGEEIVTMMQELEGFFYEASSNVERDLKAYQGLQMKFTDEN